MLTDTEQCYHSNKKEFLALKWAVTEQFHEYLSPYDKNRNEFLVRTDNNPLTYVFSSASLDASGQRWVASLASYNFFLEYQKGKDNTVTDFLSRVEKRLPEVEVRDYLTNIPPLGVKAVLDNTVTPIEEKAETPKADTFITRVLGVRPAKLSTLHVTDWKQAQKEDPVLYAVVKNLKATQDAFKEALLPLLDKKAVMAYVKVRERLAKKNGLLYLRSKDGPGGEVIWHFVVPKAYQGVALDGCHHEAGHQGQKHSLLLMNEPYLVAWYVSRISQSCQELQEV